jgi:hypothetical protein
MCPRTASLSCPACCTPSGSAERIRRGTRTDTRALGTYQQAVLALRWLFDDTRMTQLARDNGIGVSTAYDYRDLAIDRVGAS